MSSALKWIDCVGGQRYAVGPYNADYWVKRYPKDHPFHAGKWEASCLCKSNRLQSFHETPEQAMEACSEHLRALLSDWLQ